MTKQIYFLVRNRQNWMHRGLRNRAMLLLLTHSPSCSLCIQTLVVCAHETPWTVDESSQNFNWTGIKKFLCDFLCLCEAVSVRWLPIASDASNLEPFWSLASLYLIFLKLESNLDFKKESIVHFFNILPILFRSWPNFGGMITKSYWISIFWWFHHDQLVLNTSFLC